jgi:hypothetical protein
MFLTLACTRFRPAVAVENMVAFNLAPVIGLAPEMMRRRKCLGTGQNGVTGNVLLARSPKTFTHDESTRGLSFWRRSARNGGMEITKGPGAKTDPKRPARQHNGARRERRVEMGSEIGLEMTIDVFLGIRPNHFAAHNACHVLKPS